MKESQLRLELFSDHGVEINEVYYDERKNAYQQCIHDLVSKYNYRPLPKKIQPQNIRTYYQSHVDRLNLDPTKPIYNQRGTLIASQFDRVVVGDYGAFIEFCTPATSLKCQPGQEYRYSEKYSVKYYWLTTPDAAGCKIYHQQGTVKYADYQVGKYYIGIYDVFQTNSH